MLEGQLRTRRKEKAVGDHKLYYAYGSNMDMTQMETRCPDAEFIGLATLPQYRFLINERGSRLNRYR